MLGHSRSYSSTKLPHKEILVNHPNSPVLIAPLLASTHLIFCSHRKIMIIVLIGGRRCPLAWTVVVWTKLLASLMPSILGKNHLIKLVYPWSNHTNTTSQIRTGNHQDNHQIKLGNLRPLWWYLWTPPIAKRPIIIWDHRWTTHYPTQILEVPCPLHQMEVDQS